MHVSRSEEVGGNASKPLSPQDFRCLSSAEIDALSDKDFIAYIRAQEAIYATGLRAYFGDLERRAQVVGAFLGELA